MNHIAKLERRRFLSLFWFLIGFLVWQGVTVVQAFTPIFSPYPLFIKSLSLLGGALFTYHIIRLLLLKQELSDQERRQMNDERLQKNRRRSFTVGFWTMLGATGLLLLVQNAFPVATAAELLLIGIGSSLGAFLYFKSTGLSTIVSGLSTGETHE
jgi:hypothetical protein